MFTPDVFLSLLSPDPHCAEERYWTLRQKLVMYFAKRRCGYPEDLADEAMYRLVRKVSDGLEIQSAEAYLFGIARNVLHEQKDTPPPPQPEPRKSTSALRGCLARCLRQLDTETRDMLESFFLDDDREALARRLDISRNALGIRVCRARARLRPCLEECLASEGIVLKR